MIIAVTDIGIETVGIGAFAIYRVTKIYGMVFA